MKVGFFRSKRHRNRKITKFNYRGKKISPIITSCLSKIENSQKAELFLSEKGRFWYFPKTRNNPKENRYFPKGTSWEVEKKRWENPKNKKYEHLTFWWLK